MEVVTILVILTLIVCWDTHAYVKSLCFNINCVNPTSCYGVLKIGKIVTTIQNNNININIQ